MPAPLLLSTLSRLVGPLLFADLPPVLPHQLCACARFNKPTAGLLSTEAGTLSRLVGPLLFADLSPPLPHQLQGCSARRPAPWAASSATACSRGRASSPGWPACPRWPPLRACCSCAWRLPVWRCWGSWRARTAGCRAECPAGRGERPAGRGRKGGGAGASSRPHTAPQAADVTFQFRMLCNLLGIMLTRKVTASQE